MKTRINRFLVIAGLICLSLSACGGKESGPQGPPDDGMVGDWELTYEVTETNCKDAISIGETEMREITVTDDVTEEDDYCVSDMEEFVEDTEDGEDGDGEDEDMEEDMDVGVEEGVAGDEEDMFTANCSAGGDDVVLNYSIDLEEADCHMTATEETRLNYDAETGDLTGSFSGKYSVEGDGCDDDAKAMDGCEYSGSVTGEPDSGGGASGGDDSGGTDTDEDISEDSDTGTEDDSTDDDDSTGDDTDDSDSDDTGDDSTSTDTDGDSLADESDNCPDNSNADQADGDADGTGDACDEDTDNDGLCDVADLCNNNDIDPDLGYVNDWYWVDSADGDPTLHLQSGYSVLNVPRTFADGTYDGSEIVVYGVVDGFKDQTGNIYTFCTGFNGSLVGVCIEK